MNKTTMVLVLGLLSLFIKCTQPEAPFNKKKVEGEVQEMFVDYFNNVEEKGLLGEFDYLDDSEDFYWVPPGYGSALSYDSVRTILESNHPSVKSVKFRWQELEIIALSENLATYTGIVISTMIDTSSRQSEMKMIESGNVIRRKDGWKLLCGQSRVLDTP